MKKKLVYITHDTWWDTDINILPELGKEYDLEVFCSSPKDVGKCKYPKKELPPYIKFHNYNFFVSRKSPKSALLSFFYAIRLILCTYNKLTFWVVDNNIYYIYPLMLFSKAGNFILSFHNYILHGDSSKVDIFSENVQLKKYKYFHLQSEGQGVLFAKDYPEKESFYTYMAVKDFGQCSASKKIFDNGRRTFLFFGSARDYKRMDLFIEAAKKYSSKANFIIAGRCSDTKTYEDVIQNYPNITWHNTFIDNDDIPSYYNSADFIVLPYDDSTQSGPLLIAYNYNVPAIVSDLPYFTQMVTNEHDGYIFKKGYQEDLYRAIEKAINISDEEYSDMKNALMKTVLSYKEKSDFTTALRSFIINNKL